MPQINLISKIDLVENYGDTNMPLDFYFNCLDLEYLKFKIDKKDSFGKKYGDLINKYINLIDEYGFLKRKIAVLLFGCKGLCQYDESCLEN